MTAPTARARDTRSLAEADAAKYIGMSKSFLRQSRSCGDLTNRTAGPSYLKIGRTVRYLVDDLDNWLEAHRQEPVDSMSHIN